MHWVESCKTLDELTSQRARLANDAVLLPSMTLSVKNIKEKKEILL